MTEPMTTVCQPRTSEIEATVPVLAALLSVTLFTIIALIAVIAALAFVHTRKKKKAENRQEADALSELDYNDAYSHLARPTASISSDEENEYESIREEQLGVGAPNRASPQHENANGTKPGNKKLPLLPPNQRKQQQDKKFVKSPSIPVESNECYGSSIITMSSTQLPFPRK